MAPIDPDTPMKALANEAAYELFVDAGVVMPWELARLAEDDRSIRTVCELGDLDLDEMVFLITDCISRDAGAAMARAQGLATDGVDDA